MRAPTTAGRSWSWIYWWCVLWGLATGAGAGAGVGALVGGTSYLGIASGAVAGASYGAIFAVIPSLLVGAGVAQYLWERQSTETDVRRDIGRVFAAVVIVINAAALVAILVTWTPYAVLALLAGDAGGLPVLWWGRSSMTKRWDGSADRRAALT